MNTCGQMGTATGYAAALCKKYGAEPKEVGAVHISELQGLIGYEKRVSWAKRFSVPRTTFKGEAGAVFCRSGTSL